MTTAASKLLPRILGVVGAGQMGAGIAQASLLNPEELMQSNEQRKKATSSSSSSSSSTSTLSSLSLQHMVFFSPLTRFSLSLVLSLPSLSLSNNNTNSIKIKNLFAGGLHQGPLGDPRRPRPPRPFPGAHEHRPVPRQARQARGPLPRRRRRGPGARERGRVPRGAVRGRAGRRGRLRERGTQEIDIRDARPRRSPSRESPRRRRGPETSSACTS